MLLDVLANNTTAFLFYFESSNHFLPFFSIFIYKCNAYNNYKFNKAVYCKVSYALYSNVILLFTKREDVENREKNERRTNNIR